jgi:CSLREA domain-containing protein
MKRSAGVIGLAMALLVLPAAAQGATFNVNTTADTAILNGCTTEPVCSLRDAVAAANASADETDTIAIPAGNYGLTAGELALTGTGSVTISGAGARTTTIDGAGASRVLRLDGPVVAIEGVTITGGNAALAGEFAGDGGGILLDGTGTLKLVRSTVANNTAILNGGGISAPPENAQRSSITIVESTIAGNTVAGGALEGLGGGIYALGDLVVVNSTIAENKVENAGTNMGGGALVGFNFAATEGTTSATFINSTVAGNIVAAGGSGAGLSVQNPTTGTRSLTISNTIVSGNLAGGLSSDCASVTFVTSTNNLSSDASCMFLDAASKQNTNPLLGALADNGGPTNTMALTAGSPAIDAGTNTGCPATDQRGIARPQGSACDIGAFELVAGPAAKPSADLKLALRAKPKKFEPGKKLRFTLKVTNKGPDAATGVIVKGTAPALAKKIKGPKFNGKKPCSLKKAKKGKRKFTCRLGAIAAGKAKTLKIVVRTKPSSGKLRTRARVRSAVADPSLKDNKRVAVAKPKG